jgi:hypothetical protein
VAGVSRTGLRADGRRLRALQPRCNARRHADSMNIWTRPQPVGDFRCGAPADVWRECISAATRAANARHRLEVALEQLGRSEITSRTRAQAACG